MKESLLVADSIRRKFHTIYVHPDLKYFVVSEFRLGAGWVQQRIEMLRHDSRCSQSSPKHRCLLSPTTLYTKRCERERITVKCSGICLSLSSERNCIHPFKILSHHHQQKYLLKPDHSKVVTRSKHLWNYLQERDFKPAIKWGIGARSAFSGAISS